LIFILSQGLPEPIAEYAFHPTRKWRFDYAWPAWSIAVEIEGGTWSGGRHTRGKGYAEDARKYNAAAEAGWRVFRFTTEMVLTGEALSVLERVLLPHRQPA